MSVFINNLDDYIAPTQACVNPFLPKRDTNQNNSKDLPSGVSPKVSIKTDYIDKNVIILPSSQVKFYVINTKSSESTEKKVAAVSLSDCLACSGCITTAESVLIQDQSYIKLLNQLNSSDKRIIVVSISPQSLASISSHTNFTPMDSFLKISTFLKKLGVNYVVDMSSVGDIALMESREEFVKRYQMGNIRNVWTTPITTAALSSSKIILNSEVKVIDSPSISPYLPMFASQCPGWVCFAEKSQPQVLPYVSTAKSPQQIFGTIFRSVIDEKRNSISNSDNSKPVYVVSIQPCFDKKLEASRKDFYHDNEVSDSNYHEVDLVLATTELWNLIEYHFNNSIKEPSSLLTVTDYFHSLPLDSIEGCDEIEDLFRSYSVEGRNFIFSAHNSTSIEDPELIEMTNNPRNIDTLAVYNAGSGGYIDHLIRYASKTILDSNIDSLNLTPLYRTGKNSDISEIEIVSKSNPNMKLKFVKAYGFRNIQSLLLKLKRKKLDNIDFIEIMACPHGCLNGGGQIKVVHNCQDGKEKSTTSGSSYIETPTIMKERVENITKCFHDYIVQQPENSKLAKFLYSDNRLKAPASDEALRLLHTRYHSVPKLETVAPLATKW